MWTSTDYLLHAPDETDTGRILVIDDDGTETIYTCEEWRALDLGTVTRMARKKVFAEKKVDESDILEIEDLIDLVKQGVNLQELYEFFQNINDTTYQIYKSGYYETQNRIDALAKYRAGDLYWYRIW